MQITTYKPAHQTSVIDLILPIQREEFGSSITLADQPDLLQIPAVYQRGNGNFWVAIAADEVVGTVGAIDIGHGHLALRKMFVAAPYRGRAVGQQLMDTLRQWATARHVAEVYLSTIEAFTRAHRFYEKNGFEQVGAAELPGHFPRMPGDTIFYRLRLQ
ncbi:MAG: GNAT family N-acetyltransferase [Elainellaceae cyanobacterium]